MAKQTLFVLDEEGVKVLRAWGAWQKNLRGDGVRNTPQGATIAWPPAGPPSDPAEDLCVVVQLTGIALPNGGGQYVGKILLGFSTANGAGPLAMPAGMTIPDDENALILHPAESVTHELATDGTVFAIGRMSGLVKDGPHEGFTTVVIEHLGEVSSGQVYKMVITGDSDIATPAIYPARKVNAFDTPTGPTVQVLCPVAHGNNGGSDPDYIFGFQPVSGTGQSVSGSPVAWAEVGRSGQWFVVDLTYSSGNGTPASPNTYYCAVKGNNLTPTAVLPAYLPVLAPMSQATVGWGRIKPTDYSFELVIAEEEFSPVFPVDLALTSGSPVATAHYDVTVAGVTVATNVVPMRPFGTAFEVVTVATLGYGSYSGSSFVLGWTNEIFKTTTC